LAFVVRAPTLDNNCLKNGGAAAVDDVNLGTSKSWSGARQRENLPKKAHFYHNSFPTSDPSKTQVFATARVDAAHVGAFYISASCVVGAPRAALKEVFALHSQ
jgi:hypothetical protein